MELTFSNIFVSMKDERLPSNLNDYENKVDNITAKRKYFFGLII